MILGTEIITELIRKKKLVEGLPDTEMVSPEGAGIDIRVGSIYRIEGETTLGIDERIMPSYNCIGDFFEDGEKYKQLKPFKYYVIKTIEKFNIPEDIFCLIFPRSSLMRFGIFANVSECPPGYRGYLHMGLINLNNNNFNLQLGSKFAHIVFIKIKGEILKSYNGVWQNGRTHYEKTIFGDKIDE